MRKIGPAFLLVIVGAVACSKGTTRVSDDLKGDLALAAKSSTPPAYASGGVVSAREQTGAVKAKRPVPTRKSDAQAPVPTPEPQAVAEPVVADVPSTVVATREEPVAAPAPTSAEPLPPPVSAPRNAPPVPVYTPAGYGHGTDGGWGGGGGYGGTMGGVVIRGGGVGDDHCRPPRPGSHGGAINQRLPVMVSGGWSRR